MHFSSKRRGTYEKRAKLASAVRDIAVTPNLSLGDPNRELLAITMTPVVLCTIYILFTTCCRAIKFW